jgi:methionyl-tRNA formyltransferase
VVESRDAILYLAGGVRGVHCLRALLAAGEPVVAVVGHAGSENGEAARLAAQAGLPYRAPRGPNDADTIHWIHTLGCRLAVMSGYARIVKKAFLDCFADGVINLHGGPLPHYRGGSPLNWQILRGEPEIGISLLFTEQGIDSGPVLASDHFPLGADQTIDEVVAETLPRFERLLLSVLAARRAGQLGPEPQDPGRARSFAKRLPRDGWIDWRALTAQQAHDLVRALSGSYPGAFSFHAGRKLVIERTLRLDEMIVAPPGRVLARRDDGVEVACADRALLVLSARDEAGRVRPARDLLPARGADFDRLPPTGEG